MARRRCSTVFSLSFCALLGVGCAHDFDALFAPPGDADGGPGAGAEAGVTPADGGDGTDAADAAEACPSQTCSGAPCAIECTAECPCTSPITCSNQSCTVTCTGTSACDVQCLNGNCNVTVTCGAGASCSLGCKDGNNCNLTCSAGQQRQSCGGENNTNVCGSSCPKN